MDPRALAAFCAIAEHGSLTRAAAATGVAQSALSRRLSALEGRVGGRLFHRTGRGVVPTDLGSRLVLRARAILAELDALDETARGERSSPAGTVELGIVPAMSRPLVTLVFTRLQREFPRIRLRALESYSGAVEEWLAAGRIDLGIFNRYGKGAVPGGEVLMTSGIAIVGPRRHQALQAGDIAFRQLQYLPLALPPRPNALVACLADLAQRQRFVLDIGLEVNSPQLIHDAVARAGLCTVLPEHLARRDYASGQFAVARILKPAIRQSTWMSMTTQHPPSLATRCVGRLIREIASATA